MVNELKQWIEAFRSEFEKQNLIVKDITLPGDEFRFLIKSDNERGSAGIEAFIEKSSEYLTYQAAVVLGKNQIPLFRSLSLQEQSLVRNEIIELLQNKPITYEFIDNGKDFGVIIRSQVSLDYQDASELETAYNLICDTADKVLSYKNTRFPIQK